MFQDVRFALRTLRKSPGFTLAAVLTLALGIGANTAIYTVLDGVILHPAAFPESDRLVRIYQKSAHDDKSSVSYPNFLDWQKRAKSFEALSGYRSDGFTLNGRGDPEELMGLMVSQNLFSALRVQPVIGRGFTTDEDQRGGRHVVMLGEDFWKRRFAGDAGILGQSLTLESRDYEVIGIVPRTVHLDRFGNQFTNDVYVPIGQFDTPVFYDRGVGDNTTGIARLKSGVTVSQAQAEMNAISAALAAEYPDKDAGVGVNVVSLTEDVGKPLQPVLLALIAAVGFVLLIACTNVASLALARSMGRSQEFAIRFALGSGRVRLMRQIVTESMLLAIAGGAIGVIAAFWCTDGAIAVLPSALPPISQIAINQRILLFSFTISLVTGLLFGIVPALRACGTDLQSSIKHGGRGVIGSRHHVQNVLIVGEVALTLVLLIGAGLLIRTLQNLWNVNPGFKAGGAMFFYTGLSKERSATPDKIRASLQELDGRLSRLSGIESSSLQVFGLPLLGNSTAGFLSEDEAETSTETSLAHGSRIAHMYAVTPGHFHAMGIPLLRGRAFSPHDTSDSPRVIIIDEELARQVFPGQDPIGKRLRIEFFEGEFPQIIGVAAHVKHTGLDADAADRNRSEFYFPLTQLPDEMLGFAAHALAVIVRSNAAPDALMHSIRSELTAFDSGAIIQNPQPLTDLIRGSLAQRRFSLVVLGAFAAMALVLALVGIYGVISYFVTQRTNEIGIRMALGASPETIFYGVLREGGSLALIGLVIGAAGAAGLTRLMTKLLFGVGPADLVTFILAAVLLFLLSLAACYIPARRAVRIDPTAALHGE